MSYEVQYICLSKNFERIVHNDLIPNAGDEIHFGDHSFIVGRVVRWYRETRSRSKLDLVMVHLRPLNTEQTSD